MAHSFLTFEFGGNEEAAQQGRHRIEGWKQGYRLDKKLQVKFERIEPNAQPAEASAAPAKAEKAGAKAKSEAGAKGKSKVGAKSKVSDVTASRSGPADNAKIRLIVRLDFSDHEKLSHHRWLERIPTEEPFKTANPKILRAGDPDFKTTSDLFDSLD